MAIKPEQTVGANAGRTRSHNRQVVLGRVHDAGQIGRADIAKSSGLTTQAVSNIIADLLDEGMIVEQGRRAGARGLPVVLYSLNPCGGYAFGMEIRPDAVFLALSNLSGETVFSRRRALVSGALDRVTDTVLALRDTALEKTGVSPERVLGAGIVMPGPFGDTGIQGNGSDLPAWPDVDPRAWFADAMGMPVVVENDANAAAMAERIGGAAQGLKTYAFLYFGAGIGLGVVHRGHLMTGAMGNAGEIGHIPVAQGKKTVLLEEAVSRISAQRHLEAAGHSVESGEDLARLYADGNADLSDWLEKASGPLTASITIIENLFDPEAIVLGGAMPDALLDHMIDAVQLPVRSVANREGRQRPRLVRGASGRMTATLGAAALVINRALTPSISVAA